jgi:hypothetical protein
MCIRLPEHVCLELTFLWQTGTLAYFIHGLKLACRSLAQVGLPAGAWALRDGRQARGN